MPTIITINGNVLQRQLERWHYSHYRSKVNLTNEVTTLNELNFANKTQLYIYTIHNGDNFTFMYFSSFIQMYKEYRTN